jgi:hypothetical protein
MVSRPTGQVKSSMNQAWFLLQNQLIHKPKHEENKVLYQGKILCEISTTFLIITMSSNIFFGRVFTDSKSREGFLSWKQATIAPAELNLVFGRENKHMFKQSTKVGRST